MRIKAKGLHWTVVKLGGRQQENLLVRVARRPAA